MPAIRKFVRRPVRCRHLKLVGISEKTQKRYVTQLKRWFFFMQSQGWGLPTTAEQVDFAAGEFINELYQESDSYGYACDLVSAIGRFIPRCRRSLTISRSFLKNWDKTIARKRALPLPLPLVFAMSGASIVLQRTDMAALLLVGFLGLLRTSEVVTLKPSQILFLGPDHAVISLANTKTSVRKGSPEQVTINDPLVCRALRLAIGRLRPFQKIYRRPYAAFANEYRWLAAKFGLSGPRLTPYSLRRGGATWHFLRYGSLDATTLRGRWEHSRTARLYIEGASAELTELQPRPKFAALQTACHRLCLRYFDSITIEAS